MASVMANARYKYRKIGSAGSWTSTNWTGSVNSQSETLVMQKLREKHKGYDIELIEIKWK